MLVVIILTVQIIRKVLLVSTSANPIPFPMISQPAYWYNPHQMLFMSFPFLYLYYYNTVSLS